jgi:hypothetical protein
MGKKPVGVSGGLWLLVFLQQAEPLAKRHEEDDILGASE